MQSKIRLLMGAAALLYLGPLLGGIIGMAWEAVPVFVALFALWMVIMRPSRWPRDPKDWNLSTVYSGILQLLVSVVIVIVLFAVGRGIASLAAFDLRISPYFPIAVSFLATPLSRLVWDPRKGEAMEHFVDDAIAQIERQTAMINDHDQRDIMTETLLALPDDADPSLTAEALDAALRGSEGATRLCALETELDWIDPPRRGLRHGLILWATDPARTKTNIHSAQMSAFNVAGSDDALLGIFAQRAAILLRMDNGLWVNFPPAGDVEMAIKDTLSEDTRLLLQNLSQDLRHHSPEREAVEKVG